MEFSYPTDLSDTSDINPGIYSRVTFMTVIIVYLEAII